MSLPTSLPRPGRIYSATLIPLKLKSALGKAVFCWRPLKSTPEHNFFGVEFSRRRVYRIKEMIEREQPGNVLALAADISCVLDNLIRPESVTIFHLYFPDPWWEAAASPPTAFSG